jgi:hypothetical protein
MQCRRCQRELTDTGNGVCPACGENNPPVTSGVMKTSTILISAGRIDAVYRSVSEVPQHLRKRLLKCTSGINSATVLIADRRGKEELAKAIRRLPGNAQQKLMDTVFGNSSENKLWKLLKPYSRYAIGGLLAILTLLVVWFILTHK